jgi:hypothetical protein
MAVFGTMASNTVCGDCRFIAPIHVKKDLAGVDCWWFANEPDGNNRNPQPVVVIQCSYLMVITSLQGYEFRT